LVFAFDTAAAGDGACAGLNATLAEAGGDADTNPGADAAGDGASLFWWIS